MLKIVLSRGIYVFVASDVLRMLGTFFFVDIHVPHLLLAPIKSRRWQKMSLDKLTKGENKTKEKRNRDRNERERSALISLLLIPPLKRLD